MKYAPQYELHMNPIQLNTPGGAPYAASTMCMALVTASNRSMWRLNYKDMVRLRQGDEFTCVIPADNNNHIKTVN